MYKAGVGVTDKGHRYTDRVGNQHKNVLNRNLGVSNDRLHGTCGSGPCTKLCIKCVSPRDHSKNRHDKDELLGTFFTVGWVCTGNDLVHVRV